MDLNAPSLDLMSLEHRAHTIEKLTTDKGSKVNMDFSKNAGKTLIKDGKMGDIHDLHVKQGKGTGIEEYQNIHGITKGNSKDLHKTMFNKKASGKDKQKAEKDINTLLDQKLKALDNIDWDSKFPKVVLLI